MPLGILTLLVVAALIFFGFAHRVLDRLRLTDRQALLFIAAIIVFSFVDIPITTQPVNITINVGGAILPIILAIYLLLRAERTVEWIRAIIGSLVTAGVIWGLSYAFQGRPISPFEEGHTFLDPSYIFAIIAATIAYLVGRSRRGAFIAGTLGILFGDIINIVQLYVGGVQGRAAIGGAGVFDTLIITGILAVIIAEVVGETRERLQGGPVRGDGKPGVSRKIKDPEYASALLSKDDINNDSNNNINGMQNCSRSGGDDSEEN